MKTKFNRLMGSSRHTRRPSPQPNPTRAIREIDRTKVLEPAPDAPAWLVALVAPRRELEAVKALREAGYLAWHPQMVLWLSSARQRTKTKVNRPLFPRYVFVAQQKGAAKPIGACDHVTYLVGPVMAPRAGCRGLLDVLSDKQQSGDLDGTIVPPALMAGDHVAMPASGPFEGLTGIVLKSEGERAVVLLKFLGSDRPIETDANILKKVA